MARKEKGLDDDRSVRFREEKEDGLDEEPKGSNHEIGVIKGRKVNGT